jgi:predicted AAA+ superfamily ATPase
VKENVKEYLPRLVEVNIEEKLIAKGGVVIEGPKWCGKSTTARRFAKTVVELQRPHVFKQYRTFADMGDENLFRGQRPILFDEWQKIPSLWDNIRADIDDGGKRGQFILTGSAKPIEDRERHSGTGRIAKLTMRTMSLWESNDSTGEVSLADLFNGRHDISGKNDHDLNRLAFLVCRGGWPEVMFDKDRIALQAAFDYVDSLIGEDLSETDGANRNPSRARAILRSYARHVSTPARMSVIQGDIEAKETVIDPRTLDSYINAFRRLFVIEDVEAWSPSLRSKTVVRTTDVRQFADPSIATAALRITPNDLISDLKTFGLLFETMAVRDLRVYTETLGGNVYHYRDASGLEADAIIHLNNGDWGAAEVKLGGDASIEDAAKNLLALKTKVNTDKMKEPSFLMVLTGTQYAYRRPDGVLIVPISCLKN